MASNSTKKTWIAIAIAAVVIVVVMGLAVVGGSAYFISRHVHAQFVSSESAETQFARARARFAGQTPLVEIGRDGDAVVHRTSADGGAPITVLHAIVYNTDTRKLVTVNVPMWLLRMLPSHKRFGFIDDDVDFDSNRTRITVEDIDRHGPGLLVDGQDHKGALVLVWAE
jgi:hypothetical protein